MRDMLEQTLARYEELEKALLDPQIANDPSRMAAIARERGGIAKLAARFREFKEINQRIADTLALAQGDDPEMAELAEAELIDLRKQQEEAFNDLLDLTMGGEDATRTRCVMEIRAGVGGDEGALFARDLYEMYRKYAESQGWKVEILEMHPTEMGGFKEIILGIEGEGVYRTLQYESGGHRVQRVPETEAKGRIHTSAATVAVMPEPEDVEVELKREDYREDVYHASGPGGQHVNKTASAIRLTHLETGIVVTCQDEKSQHKNRAKALRVLKTRLYEYRQQQENAKRAAERKSLVGSGDRSQRIRTYNFPENRVTDHRINFTIYKLDSIMAGNMEPLIEACKEYARSKQREAFGAIT